ncbi:PQQ-dependent sugar dehydrogenase [Nocardioides marmotae]|uniref:PQQ-dependent sugar dehydrogenase n=1 Tax=Nocardioides marmotae TaxID=2663857 RepID=UPI0012B6065A|nr:PQQ-dependent sugar dehydrogenase [Nocardioides marmotae]MBC9735264.1 PQQ-dependent sugar dehydrogenase [Nocardioides marmotae]MTB86364.1 PQQ-dependent sugar dehydrogenase [Nocardioides marmotae]
MRALPVALLSSMVLALVPAPAGALAQEGPPAVAAPAAPSAKAPALRVRTVVAGLDKPWDVKPITGGRLLVTERDRARLLLVQGGRATPVDFPSSSVWVSGETGLMSLEVDPDFADNQRFYTCQGGFTAGGGHDVRVMAWKLKGGAAKPVRKLIGGFPTSSGRHGGCRLLIARNGALLVGTGDAAVGTNPRNLRSLGGKVLRLDRRTGKPWPGNPFAKAGNRAKRYVFTYGHRNVQGLAQRPDGTLWSVEHGSFRDDEVNRLVRGGDYGWNPVPGYNEQVPMTDQSLPGTQQAARWRSGNPTIATSGAAWVQGRRWGSYAGMLAVGVQKGERVLFLRFDAQGRLKGSKTPGALRQFGRIRSVVNAPNGDLLITTDNGSGRDRLLRVSPR